MDEAFIDLNGLIVRCKDKQAKKFIQEAVTCYQVGAYCSCIVSTWNAVMFNFFEKLQELDILGNEQASELLKRFKYLRDSQDKFKELYQFESYILYESLNLFEFISSQDKSDIERLFEDKNRCAHLSMTSLEKPLQATAELARCHLKNAVMHLLERKPIQDRVARERIFQQIKSLYFPYDIKRAVIQLKKALPSCAKYSLIQDIIIDLTVSLLTEDIPFDEQDRKFCAINAISCIYPEQTKEIFKNKLSDILNKIDDNDFDKVIIYLGEVEIWNYIDENYQLKAIAYIQKINIYSICDKVKLTSVPTSDFYILEYASYISFLRVALVEKLQIPLKYLLILRHFLRVRPVYIFKPQQESINQIVEDVLNKTMHDSSSFNEIISVYWEATNMTSRKLLDFYLQVKLDEANIEDSLEWLLMMEEKDNSLVSVIEKHLLIQLEIVSINDLIEIRGDYLKKLSEAKLNSTILLLNNYLIKKL